MGGVLPALFSDPPVDDLGKLHNVHLFSTYFY